PSALSTATYFGIERYRSLVRGGRLCRNKRFSRSSSYYAPRSFLGVVKAVTLIKQGTLMNWRRYREAVLLTGEGLGIRVGRLIHRDRVVRRKWEQTRMLSSMVWPA